jgi:hypothetical protein
MILAPMQRTVVLAVAALLLNYALARADIPYGPSVASAFVVVLLATQVGLGIVW